VRLLLLLQRIKYFMRWLHNANSNSSDPSLPTSEWQTPDLPEKILTSVNE
jgi:hypothetical protein